MTYPHNHKTVLVLDRGPAFLKSSEQNIDFDVINKSRTPGIIPMAPLAKSMWTCNVEACMEFCRIVFDIYPNKKLVSWADMHEQSYMSECTYILSQLVKSCFIA